MIIHCIFNLSIGGAEKALARLTHNISVEQKIVAIKGGGIEQDLQRRNIDYILLENCWKISEFQKLCRSLRAATVFWGWMYHGSLISVMLRIFYPKRRLVWHFHHASVEVKDHKVVTINIIRILRYLSKLIEPTIIYCAKKGRLEHERFGFPSAGAIVIPNFLDQEFYDLEQHLQEAGRKLNPPFKNLIKFVVIARWHPDKDIEKAIRFFKGLKDHGLMFSVDFFGAGLCDGNFDLTQEIEKRGLGACTKLNGMQNISPQLLKNYDALVLSSRNEASPNVVLEALCCGLLIISEDVGDVSRMVSMPPNFVGHIESKEAFEFVVNLSMHGYDREEYSPYLSADYCKSVIVQKYESIIC